MRKEPLRPVIPMRTALPRSIDEVQAEAMAFDPGKIDDYYARLLELANKGEFTLASLGDDIDAEKFYETQKIVMKKLFTLNGVNSPVPTEFIVALTDLAGMMAHYDLVIPENNVDDEEEQRIATENYQQAKEIFLEACARLYPDLETLNPTQQNINNQVLSLRELAPFVDTIKNSPQNLLQNLHEILFVIGKTLFKDTYYMVVTWNPRKKRKKLNLLNRAVQIFYQLQRMCDVLEEDATQNVSGTVGGKVRDIMATS